jgi:hypothetical protein
MQYMQRRAPRGILLRHSGQSFSVAASALEDIARSFVTGRTTRK